MGNENELANVLETLLMVPGMNDVVKIDLKLPRTTILLLAQIIEKGLAARKDEKGTWSEAITQEQENDLKQLATDALERAGLTPLSQKLKTWKVVKG